MFPFRFRFEIIRFVRFICPFCPFRLAVLPVWVFPSVLIFADRFAVLPFCPFPFRRFAVPFRRFSVSVWTVLPNSVLTPFSVLPFHSLNKIDTVLPFRFVRFDSWIP